MPFISSTFNLTGAVGMRPLSVVEGGQTVLLGAIGGGAGWLGAERVAATVFETVQTAHGPQDVQNGATWARVAPYDWRRSANLWDNRAANRFNCAETGDWLASYQPPEQSQWKVWGQIGGHPFEALGLLCDDMASDGTYCVSGLATSFQRRVHWPSGQVEIFPAGTELKLSPGFICYRLPYEKHIRVFTPTGQLAVSLVGTEQYPGPIVHNIDNRVWLYYTTADRGHVSHPSDDNTRGYWWPTGNQFYQACRLNLDAATYAWALGQGDDPPYGLSQHVLGHDMVDLPADVVPPEPPMPDVQAIRRTLESIRATYPNPLEHDGQAGEILNKGCWAHKDDGWGLLHKPGGGGVHTPQGVLVPYDIINQPNGQHWDCATGEWPQMTIIDPIGPHESQAGWQWIAPVEPTEPPDPPDPPPVFDKEKAKEPSIKASAEFVSPVIGIPVPDAAQGCREMWDKYPPDYLPSVQELACGATWRSGCSPVPDELINQHITKAIAETLAIRRLSGYACGPASAPPVAIERVRVKGLGWETVTGKPWQWRGCTSFDLPYHVGKHGNAAWADYLASERFTVARIVPASCYRNPRTLAEGIAWLPKTLDVLKARGLYAEVTILVDTGEGSGQYDMDGDAMRSYVAEIGAILSHYPNVIAEVANENGHQQNQNYLLLTDPGFLAELRSLIPSNVMTSWGSHGGDQMQINGGEYVTIHTNRGQTPDQNAADLANWQGIEQVPIVDDEPLGIAEVASGNRTNDPAYGEQCARANRQQGVVSSTLHLDAGLTADVARLGPIQREAVQRFIRAMTEAL